MASSEAGSIQDADQQAEIDTTAILHDESLDLEAGPGQAVSADTNLQVGSEVQIRATLFPNRTPFVHEQDVTVSANGKIHTVFNFSSVPENATVELAIVYDGEPLTNETTTIDHCEQACVASTVDPTAANATLDPETLTLEAGPGRVLHGNSSLPSGTELRVSVSVEGSGEPTLLAETATVESDGTFRAQFDLSTLDPEEDPSADVAVTIDHTELVTADLSVQACTSDCTPPPVPPSPEFGGDLSPENETETVLGETLLIPIALHETASAQLEIVGTTEESLNATITVTDESGDGQAIVAVNTHPEQEEPTLFAGSSEDSVAIENQSGSIRPDTAYRLILSGAEGDGGFYDFATFRVGDSPLDEGTQQRSDQEESAGVNHLTVSLLALAAVLASVGIGLLVGLLGARR